MSVTILPGLSLTVHSIGEIRMGLEGYGVTIEESDGRVMKALASEPVFTSSEPAVELAAEMMSYHHYLLLHGLFSTYVFDFVDWKLSLFRATIRGQSATGEGFWTEENPIYGPDKKHLTAESGRHYFVQFPFVSDEEFPKVWQRYLAERTQQILSLQAGT